MHIVTIGWLYVVLMMSITEDTVVAGVLTFLMYGLVPVAILLYISGSKQRKRKRAAELAAQQAAQAESKAGSQSVSQSASEAPAEGATKD